MLEHNPSVNSGFRFQFGPNQLRAVQREGKCLWICISGSEGKRVEESGDLSSCKYPPCKSGVHVSSWGRMRDLSHKETQTE